MASDERPLTFIAPELPEETLLEREHNEILAKLNFVLALCECVCEVARSRAAPLAAVSLASTGSGGGGTGGNTEQQQQQQQQPQQQPASTAATRRRAEQVILLVRALQWLSAGLSLATQQLKAGRLQPTANVKEGKIDFAFVLSAFGLPFCTCFFCRGGTFVKPPAKDVLI